MNQAYHPDIPISVFRAMDGNDAMKLVLPAAAFAVGVPRCKFPWVHVAGAGGGF